MRYVRTIALREAAWRDQLDLARGSCPQWVKAGAADFLSPPPAFDQPQGQTPRPGFLRSSTARGAVASPEGV